MSRPKRSGQIQSVIYTVISCVIMAVPVPFLVLTIVDHYHEAPPPVAANLPDFSVGPADWRELYWLKNKPAPSREADAQTDLSPEDLYDLVAPSVVKIIVKDENEEPIGSGSGFFVDKALLGERYAWLDSDREPARLHNENGSPTQHGYVLTNYHVIRPAVHADVLLFNGDKGTVLHVVGEDEIADLALLSVSVSYQRPLRPIPLAASNPRVLSTVYAIGSPKGLEGTVSQGEVSAYRAIFGSDHWLQTTAPVSPGSSGGPLVSPQGELVGVTTLAHKEGQNLNFAIPESVIRSFFLATNFNLRRRDVAEGASIRWQEDKTFGELRTAVESPHYTTSQHDALELLDAALKELHLGELFEENRDEQEVHYHRAVVLAEDANKSLPDEFKYLSHYIAGKASITAQEASGWDRRVPTVSNTTLSKSRDTQFLEGDDTTAAITHFVEATTLEPQFAPPHRYLALCHAHSGNWSDALSVSRTLVRLLPRNVAATQLLAECYTELGQPKVANEVLQDAAKHTPHNGSLLNQLARSFADLGNYREAIHFYGLALKCRLPGLHGATHYDLGVAYKEVERFEDAMAEFTSAKSYGWNSESCDNQIAECIQRHSLASVNRYQQQTTPEQREATVYVTKTGTKYHLDGCQYLRKSRIPMQLSEAAPLYEPCSRCGALSPLE